MPHVLAVRVAAAKFFKVIMAWGGSVAGIPSGWHLCDGTGGTPDLRSSFIRATDFTDTFGPSGTGTNTRDRTHRHTVQATVSESSHGHNFTGATFDMTGSLGGGGGTDFTAGAPHDHSVSFSTTAAGAHSHGFNGPTAYDNEVGEDTRPAFYALCYIYGPADDLPVGAVVWYNGLVSDMLAVTAGSIATLTAPITSSSNLPTTLTFSNPVPFRIVIGNESIIIADASVQPWVWDTRGADGTTATAHASGTAILQPKYAVCDGNSDNTPKVGQVRHNVHDYFIGADGGTYIVGTEGGTTQFSLSFSSSHTHGAGSLTITADTSHTHPVVIDASSQDSFLSPQDALVPVIAAVTADPHGHGDNTGTTDTSTHTHGANGTNQVLDVVDRLTEPQTYVLAFLQRIAA